MASFASDLLDAQDLLYRRSDGVLKSCTEFAEFISDLAKIEKEYASKLSRIAAKQKKDFKKAPAHQAELATTSAAWDTVLNELEKVAEHHNQFGEKIEKDITVPIHAYVKEKQKKKKTLEEKGMKQKRDYKDALENLARARSKYVTLSKEAEAADGIHTKGKGDMSMKPNNLAKLAQKATLAAEKASQSDTEYQEALRATNEKQTLYYTSFQPDLLREFQQFEEERIKYMKDMLDKLSAFFKEKPGLYNAAADSITGAAESVSVDSDIQAYIASNKTGVAPPANIEYKHYSEGETGHAAPAATPSGKVPPKAPKPGKIGKYKGPASGSVPTGHREWGLSAADQSLPVEDQINKLNDQSVELDKLVATETKTKEGLDNLVRFYASDPVARKKAEDQVTESLEKLQSLNDSKATVQHLLQQLHGGGTATYGQSSSLRARGLYNYDATCDTELSFKEGDILSVTEQDDSGWWYCELNGQSGFVPNNYVELI